MSETEGNPITVTYNEVPYWLGEHPVGYVVLPMAEVFLQPGESELTVCYYGTCSSDRAADVILTSLVQALGQFNSKNVVARSRMKKRGPELWAMPDSRAGDLLVLVGGCVVPDPDGTETMIRHEIHSEQIDWSFFPAFQRRWCGPVMQTMLNLLAAKIGEGMAP